MTTAVGRRNLITVIALVAIVGAMGGLVSAAVPLYRMFCQVTGYGGTTRVAEAAPGRISDRVITVRFNADTNSALGWKFAPKQRQMDVRLGQQALARYRARNLEMVPVTGSATFNVTPAKAGAYFNKIACFCFARQTLMPGEAVDMPVTFFVDPAMAEDRNLDDVTTITLSYTFFRVSEGDPGKPATRTSRAAPKPANNVLN